MPGASREVLTSPEIVARKVLLAIMTRPRVLNVTPLQTAAVALAEVFPGIAEAVLERNPSLVGAGPSIAVLEMQRDNNGRGEKIALPSARQLSLTPEISTEPPAHVIPSSVEGQAPPRPQAPPPIAAHAPRTAEPDTLPEESERAPLPPTRWQYEPPESALDEAAEPAPPVIPSAVEGPPQSTPSATTSPSPLLADLDEEELAAQEPTAQHDVEPPMTGSSFDAALESLQKRMDRAKLTTDFVRSLLIVDNVIDVGEAAMRWAGMPNKHERSLTSEVFFALAEWGFLAPRADGRYRVLHAADDDPTI
jgi:hypothetical protein